jgi:hypothetical protein
MSPPILMADVVRELKAIASVAERCDDLEVVAACRRAESLVARLRNQFLDDLLGDEPPSARAA